MDITPHHTQNLPMSLLGWGIRARVMMNRYGLFHWGFSFLDGTKDLGQCDLSNLTISLSKQYVVHGDPELVDDTLRHEIAHALVTEDVGALVYSSQLEGHGKEWKEKCKITGAKPEQSKSERDIQLFKYKCHCPACGTVVGVHEIPQEYVLFCGYCDSDLALEVDEVI